MTFPADLTTPLAWVAKVARREVARLRARHVLSPDELRGLVVGDALIDVLIRPQPPPADGDEADSEIAAWLGSSPAWQLLGLAEAERRVLVLALAPEAEARFTRVYAYLNDHAGRGRLTRDLALRLAGGGLTRDMLSAGGPLLRSGLIRIHDDEQVAWSLQGLILTPAAAHVLQGLPPTLAPLPAGCTALNGPPAWPAAELARLPALLEDSDDPPWLVFHGRPGSRRTRAAVALASLLGVPAMRADLERVLAAGALGELLDLQALTGAVAVLDGGTLLDDEGRLAPGLAAVGARLAASRARIVWRCRDPQAVERLAAGRHRALAVNFDRWTADDRSLAWAGALAANGAPAALDLEGLATRYRLTPGQVEAAARRAAEAAAAAGRAAVAGDVYEAAREQSRTGIGRLATRVECHAGWDDVVLPPQTLVELRGFVRAVRHRSLVFEHWGFGCHTAGGRGIVAIFSGAPGTGKTLSAEVIAGELELDLYRIELSTVVSKYIGETEANLQRVFEAARDLDAMLLFDECDALFGKRSEVSDAHDRYANTEIAYLLQAVEAHASQAGPVVLCTNRLGDLDGAFLRRIQHVVDFPTPKTAALRRALFERHLPPALPVGTDVDLDFMAEHFELAGGDVRNVVYDACVRAAADGRTLRMEHLIEAMARQLRRRGTTPTATMFKQHYPVLQRARARHEP